MVVQWDIVGPQMSTMGITTMNPTTSWKVIFIPTDNGIEADTPIIYQQYFHDGI
jgi:hypothetical protein